MASSFYMLGIPSVTIPPGLFDREELSVQLSLADPPKSILLGAFGSQIQHMKMFSFIAAIHINVLNVEALAQYFSFTPHTSSASDEYIIISFTLADAFLFTTQQLFLDDMTRMFAMWLTEAMQGQFKDLYANYTRKMIPNKNKLYELVRVSK